MAPAEIPGHAKLASRLTWRQQAKKLAQLVGIDISRWRPPERRLANFLAEHAIHTVLDVGANSGQFGRTLRASGFRGRIISFEPLAEPFKALSELVANDPSWEAHRIALGDSRGRLEMNVASNSTSSSFFEIEHAHLAASPVSRFVTQEVVDVERLDDVVLGLGLVGPTLLKLDVQGYHLAVLRGATATLDDVEAIQCELSVLPLYSGEPMLVEVLTTLRAMGFELTELEPGFYDPRTGRILQFDGRFSKLKENGS
jgi:FkbM family methyltransferase